jgi:hypothetical protein
MNWAACCGRCWCSCCCCCCCCCCCSFRYGCKAEATALLQEWVATVGSKAGLTAANTRLSSGCLGVPESRLEVGIHVLSLPCNPSCWATGLLHCTLYPHPAPFMLMLHMPCVVCHRLAAVGCMECGVMLTAACQQQCQGSSAYHYAPWPVGITQNHNIFSDREVAVTCNTAHHTQ